MQIAPVNLIKNLTKTNFGTQSKVPSSNVFLKNNQCDSFSFTGRSVKPKGIGPQTMSALLMIDDRVFGLLAVTKLNAKSQLGVVKDAYSRIPENPNKYTIIENKDGTTQFLFRKNFSEDGDSYSATIEEGKVRNVEIKNTGSSKCDIIETYSFNKNGELSQFKEFTTEGAVSTINFSKDGAKYEKKDENCALEITLNPDGTARNALIKETYKNKSGEPETRTITKETMEDGSFIITDSSNGLFDHVINGESHIKSGDLG